MSGVILKKINLVTGFWKTIGRNEMVQGQTFRLRIK